jgi:hypothetical protein
MKLSERLVIHECTGNMYPQQIIEAIKQIESDSQMLNDLLELLQTEGEHAICLIVTAYRIGQASYKETVQAAISEWRKGK